ncbi:MAG TPA: outer membrane beta-barrel protein [Gemmatimonas sp.]|uniref:outer membrane beta-barrel protein n=1 Tax=Gemmatimonas sp. TaxID=1962908 RepID=UPI002EDA8DF6
MNTAFVRRSFSVAAVLTTLAAAPLAMPLAAQQTSPMTGNGGRASLTPFAGFMVNGNWYDGPVGTSLKNTNGPVFGAQASFPLASMVSLVGSLGYSSGDLRIGAPIIGGVNVGSANTWMYDAGVELGGLGARTEGLAPFATVGIGGMTNNIEASILNVRATNVAYTLGVGMDIGFTPGMALRLQAKDWIGRFNSEDAIGFRVNGNTAHSFALTAGLKFTF